MSDAPEIALDLEALEQHLLPAWAKSSPETNRYARFDRPDTAPDRSRPDRLERRGFRGPRPDRPGRREGGPGEKRGRDAPRAGFKGGSGRHGKPRHEERREPLPPLPEVAVNFVTDEKGVESLARQIKLTGRAYPIFDIAQLILRRPERYLAIFSVVKKADGQVAQQLWACNLDDTLWLSEADAVRHVLIRHFNTFYQAEKTPTDPPKGTYTFVAQCGLSGAILGPPNYHDYQIKLRKLHDERFASMPFEAFKSRVRIVRDEAVVKKWIEDQSWKTEFVCLNVPEPRKLGSRDEVEQHFREVHLGNIIRTVDTHTLNGTAAQQLPAPALRNLLRRAWDEQSRFPLRLVNVLSQQFANHGLQFFKVNKSITHVAVARPHFLDMVATPVSDGVKRIVDFIDATAGCTRRKLIEALAPSPATPPAAPPSADAVSTGTAPSVAPVAAHDLQHPTPEQTAVIADLHWLIHQGHVIEFANGKMETAKRPLPRPPKPPPKAAVPAVAHADTTPTATSSSAESASTSTPGEPEVIPDVTPSNAAPATEACVAPSGADPDTKSPGAVAGDQFPDGPQPN